MIYRTGDIFHCQGKKLLSRIIMKLTKSHYSHSALFIEIEGNQFVIDAQKDGVNMRPFGAWMDEYGYKFRVMRSPNALIGAHMRNRAMSKIGHTAYDFEGLLIKSPIELVTGKWKHKCTDAERMYCSEYVAWCYRIEEYYRMSPQDLFEYCLKNNFTEVHSTL